MLQEAGWSLHGVRLDRDVWGKRLRIEKNPGIFNKNGYGQIFPLVDTGSEAIQGCMGGWTLGLRKAPNF